MELNINKTSYVIDTSVLIAQPEIVHSFPGEKLYIPIEVIEELDNIKIRDNEAALSARYVLKFLDSLREKGNLYEGVELENEQIIIIYDNPHLVLEKNVNQNVDNKIILIAENLSSILLDEQVICLSNDFAIRVKCSAKNIPSRGTEASEGLKRQEKYMGINTLDVFKYEIDQLYTEGVLPVDKDFYPNEGVLLKADGSSGLAIADGKGNVRKLKHMIGKTQSVQGISPKNKEQTFALEFLLDKDVHMVTLSGIAGTGKSLLALAAAIDMLEKKQYDKLILARPMQSMSKDIGFLPGDKNEKVGPWLSSIFDNGRVLLGKNADAYFEQAMHKGTIEMESFSFIRGRTLPKTIFLIDEAQNITHHEAKAVLTRMGVDSKIILLGDLDQIDSPKLNKTTSGLNSVIELFKEFPHSAHVTLTKGERSELATFASKVM
jgi:PhoH-like ATPase